MTDEFSKAYWRDSFREPMRVSESLLAVSERPISWLFESWENRIDLSDPSTLIECVIPSGDYRVPSFDAILKRSAEKMIPTAHDVVSETFSDLNEGLLHQVEPYDGSIREMSEDEAIFIAVYVPYSLGWMDSGAGLQFKGFGFPNFLHYSWASEFGPLLLSSNTEMFKPDGWFGETLDESPTIGEVLHVTSRFPQAFRAIEDKRAYRVCIWEALKSARGELRAIAGDSWMSYVILTSLIPVNSDWFRTDELVKYARWFIETGLSVEDIQKYVDFDRSIDGVGISNIQEVISSGIAADVLPSLSVPA